MDWKPQKERGTVYNSNTSNDIFLDERSFDTSKWAAMNLKLCVLEHAAQAGEKKVSVS